MMEYIGLLGRGGRVEYNARLLLGNQAAESLQWGAYYTTEELRERFNVHVKEGGKWCRCDIYGRTSPTYMQKEKSS